MLLRTVVVLLAVSLFAGSVCAQPRVGRDSLKGIGAIRIVVEPRIRVAEREVLLAGLHTAVELRLRQNRVPIAESVGQPYLYHLGAVSPQQTTWRA